MGQAPSEEKREERNSPRSVRNLLSQYKQVRVQYYDDVDPRS
jgi:hypothetical protein